MATSYLKRKSKLSWILKLGNRVSDLLFIVGIIAFITGIVGLIISAEWTGNAWLTFAGSLTYIIVWFIASLFLFNKHKKLVQTDAERMAENLYKQTKDKVKVNFS